MAVALAPNSASRSELAALRAEKNLSCAALKRAHNASSRSFAARPAAFHSVNKSRNAPAVGPHSVESASVSARSHSASLACLTPTRSRSRSAKCDPRLRLNVSRAAEYRFHSASSVLRSSPVIVRHSSRIRRSRSPAAFHCVELVAMSSASAANASFRAVCVARCSCRRSRSACAAESACSAMALSRAANASTSPSTAAVGRPSARAAAADLILRASPVPEASRPSMRATSVCRSS